MAVRTLWSWVAPRSETMVSLEEPSLLWSASILQRNSGVVFWKLPTTAPTDGDRLELIRGTLTLSVVKWEELAAAWRKCFKRSTRYLSSCPKSPFKHTLLPLGLPLEVGEVFLRSLLCRCTLPVLLLLLLLVCDILCIWLPNLSACSVSVKEMVYGLAEQHYQLSHGKHCVEAGRHPALKVTSSGKIAYKIMGCFS